MPLRTLRSISSITIIQVRASWGFVGPAPFRRRFRSFRRRWAISKFRGAISKSLREISKSLSAIAQRNSAQNVVAFRINPFKGLIWLYWVSGSMAMCFGVLFCQLFFDFCALQGSTGRLEKNLRLTSFAKCCSSESYKQFLNFQPKRLPATPMGFWNSTFLHV